MDLMNETRYQGNNQQNKPVIKTSWHREWNHKQDMIMWWVGAEKLLVPWNDVHIKAHLYKIQNGFSFSWVW